MLGTGAGSALPSQRGLSRQDAESAPGPATGLSLLSTWLLYLGPRCALRSVPSAVLSLPAPLPRAHPLGTVILRQAHQPQGVDAQTEKVREAALCSLRSRGPGQGEVVLGFFEGGSFPQAGP